MTTHNDQHDVETMLRASLRDRAGDVDTTPALYERIEQQAARGLWLRRGFALAAVAAAVVGAFVVVPGLLPDQPLRPDVLDTPEDAAPSDGAPPDGTDDQAAEDWFQQFGLVRVRYSAGEGEIDVAGRRVFTDRRPATVATGRGGVVVVGFEDGSIGGLNPGGTGEELDEVVDASANGGAVVITPLGDGVAWIDGRTLNVLPLADGAAVRRLPLQGEVPDDLRIEQWFAGADAQVILATAPGGGLWSIPMDDSDVYDSAPTDDAFVLAEDAVDGAILDDLTRVELALDETAERVELRRDGDPATAVATTLPPGTDVALTTDGRRLVLQQRSSGSGALFQSLPLGPEEPAFAWGDDTVVAVAPLEVPLGPAEAEGDGSIDPTGDGSEGLGLRTDAPVIGTDGIQLVIRSADGNVTRQDLYRPAVESEAMLGHIAVRPGSSTDDGLVALSSFSEGEWSVRFAAIGPDLPEPVGSILPTQGEVTGLVWSEDGGAVAWTDEAGLHVATVDDGGRIADSGPVYDGTRPVIDWVWTEDDGSRTGGWFAVRTGETGTEFLGVDRFRNGGFVATGPAGGADRLVLDTHVNPGAAVGPDVTATISGRAVDLRWGADGDRFGDLLDPAPYDVDGTISVEASGGQVIVMSAQGAASMITFDGEVVTLPDATDWDVLD